MNKPKTISVSLDYWKNYVTLYHVLACELSYSLIYNNIRPEKLKDALATVGMDTLPNRFLLIQVDDYFNYSSKMHITQEFFQKTSLINLLRECMEKMEIKGFMANLVGLDKLICFLCCPEWEDETADTHLLKLAEEFKKYTKDKSDYTISVCISKYCNRLGQYSQMYPMMDLALSKSYFSGKEFSILLENTEDKETPKEANLHTFYAELLAAFARCNQEQLENVLQKILKALLEGQTRPQKAKMEMIRLMQKLSNYCVQCGLPEAWVQKRSDTAIAQILSCNFVTDTRSCFVEFYEDVTQKLGMHRADEEYSFKIPICEYINAHYMEDIKLGYSAEMIGFSEGHFARVFRREFGMTFVQYLTQYRIERSKELLQETNIPIEQVAYQVGINSCSYFCTCFKRWVNTSPREFRDTAMKKRKEESLSGE